MAALEEVAVEDIALYKLPRRLSFGRIAVLGEQTGLRWGKDKQMHVWGFRLPSSSDAAPAVAPPLSMDIHSAANEAIPTPAPEKPANPLGLEFKNIVWDVGEVNLIDETLTPETPTVYTASLAGVIENAIFNGQGTGVGTHGRLDTRLAIPGLVESIRVGGSLDSQGPTTLFNLTVDGSGMALADMAPYLRPLGIEPRLDMATLQARLSGQLAPEPEGLTFSLALEDFALADANRTYLSLDSLDIDRF
ncbi:DUF748 domain-containing protein, partial [Planctomycetota bacterium]